MSSLLSYHIFSFFISNIFENFKFGRNFSKFTADMGCRLVAVSVKIGGNRRLPIGKENTVDDSTKSREHRCTAQPTSRATDALYVSQTLLPLSQARRAVFLYGSACRFVPLVRTGRAAPCLVVGGYSSQTAQPTQEGEEEEPQQQRRGRLARKRTVHISF